MPTKPKTGYTVLVGLNYPIGNGVEVRAEPGDVVDNLPPGDIEWMLAEGMIKRVGGSAGPHLQSTASPSSSSATPDPLSPEEA